jgi:hypothetical protein
MSREKEGKEKSGKKSPLKNLKEKRADKAAKKRSHNDPISIIPPDKTHHSHK